MKASSKPSPSKGRIGTSISDTGGGSTAAGKERSSLSLKNSSSSSLFSLALEQQPKRLSQWAVYLSLGVTQVGFSFGAVYLKLCLQHGGGQHTMHPVAFALHREGLATPPLLAISWVKSGLLFPPIVDLPRFALIGVALYLNQLLFITGLSLSGAVIATCIQPSIPVLTAGIAIVLGYEDASRRKIIGIALAVSGALCMVVGNSSGTPPNNIHGQMSSLASRNGGAFLGNLCLLGNCLCAAVFYIAIKQTSYRFHPSNITAWAYSFATLLMAATAAVTVPAKDWSLPRSVWGPLAYWVVVSSVVGYYILTWAASKLPASHVAASQCLQPFAGTLFGWLLLKEPITPWDLAAIVIVAGLACIISDSPDLKPQKLKTANSRERIPSPCQDV